MKSISSLFIMFFCSLWLVGCDNNGATYTPKEQSLNINLPIYTQAIGGERGAMVCPITILDDRDLNKSPKRIMDIASSFSNRSEKIKEVGCQEWKGGLEVRMADSELSKLQQWQSEKKVGFLFFQNRPLNQGIDFLMVYTGDLTNNPSGEYGETYTPPNQTNLNPTDIERKTSIGNKTLRWRSPALLEGVIEISTYMDCCSNGVEHKSEYKRIKLNKKVNFSQEKNDDFYSEMLNVDLIAVDWELNAPEGVPIKLSCSAFDLGVTGHFALPVNCMNPKLVN